MPTQCPGSQFAVRGRTGQVAPMATGYGPRSSRGLRTCAAQCLGSQFAVRGRAGQVASMAAGLWLVLIKRVAHVRVVWLVGDWKSLAYFVVRGRTGQVAPGAAGLWLVLIERVVYVREVWLVRDWKSLAMGGVWPGAVHLGWSKSPRWMGARRCAGVSFPGWAERKQF